MVNHTFVMYNTIVRKLLEFQLVKVYRQRSTGC